MNKIGNEINELILDLAVDEFYKYNQNRGLNFTFWQMQKYFFCCACCKNKNQIQLEKTYKRALDELFKSIDIVNVIKCTQQIKVLKEIIFDPTQREIFNHLLRTTIDGENVISSFNTEISSKLDSIEEDHILQKSSLKDSFVQLSKQDCYNSTELKLIDILYLDPGLKKKFFNHEEKDPNNKINLYSIV